MTQEWGYCTIFPSPNIGRKRKRVNNMAKLLYRLEGVRGRSIMIYDRKCTIATKLGVGSLITGNATDGEKTIFYKDVVGLQFKKSGGLIGYLQFESGSVQMNNQNSNMFSENTFTFENGKNGVTNELMEGIYYQLQDIIEEIKHGDVTGNRAAPVAIPTPAPAPAPMPAPAPVPAATPTVGTNFCTSCGKELSPAAKFCVGCGKPID